MSCRILVPAVLFLYSCGDEADDGGVKVASAFGKHLYESDLKAMETDGPLSEQERENYIDDWVRQQVLLNKAKSELKGIERKIQHQLEKYKANLIMYEYEKYKIDQRLDTLVTSEEILKYYEENTEDFELNDYLVRAIFAKAPKSAMELNKANLWFRSNDSLDHEKLKAWSSREAVKFYFDNESWLYFEDIKKMLPKEMVYNEQNFIINRWARKYEDEEFVYFFRVMDFRTGISPLEFEKENIRSRILQMRIAALRDALRKEILNEAYNSDEIKRY